MIGFVVVAIFGNSLFATHEHGFPTVLLSAIVVLFVTKIIMSWVFYASLESSGGMGSPGKRVLRLRVTDFHGNKVSFGRATGRYFGKYISALCLLIGFFMAAFTHRKQAFHDIITSTLVLEG